MTRDTFRNMDNKLYVVPDILQVSITSKLGLSTEFRAPIKFNRKFFSKAEQMPKAEVYILKLIVWSDEASFNNSLECTEITLRTFVIYIICLVWIFLECSNHEKWIRARENCTEVAILMDEIWYMKQIITSFKMDGNPQALPKVHKKMILKM